MNQNYQDRYTDQICKMQTGKNLIAFYDRLRYASLTHYAQLHAAGEFKENDRKVHSLISISIQDYSKGTGEQNVITQYNLAPEQLQFLLTRVNVGFQEYYWTDTKIFGVPDAQGMSIARQFTICRRPYDANKNLMKNPWSIQIINGKGIRAMNNNGGAYLKSNSFIPEKTAFIQLTDMNLYTLLKRVDAYITQWENCISSHLIQNGKQALSAQAAQQNQAAQNQQQPPLYEGNAA